MPARSHVSAVPLFVLESVQLGRTVYNHYTSICTGFYRKSYAPCCMAFMAFARSLLPVMTITFSHAVHCQQFSSRRCTAMLHISVSDGVFVVRCRVNWTAAHDVIPCDNREFGQVL